MDNTNVVSTTIPPRAGIKELISTFNKKRTVSLAHPKTGINQKELEAIKMTDFVQNLSLIERDDKPNGELIIIHGNNEMQAIGDFPELLKDDNYLKLFKEAILNNTKSKYPKIILLSGYAAFERCLKEDKLFKRKEVIAKATINKSAFADLPRWQEFCKEFELENIKFPVSVIEYTIPRIFIASKYTIIATAIIDNTSVPILWYDKNTNAVFTSTNPYSVFHTEGKYINSQFGIKNGCAITNIFINYLSM